MLGCFSSIRRISRMGAWGLVRTREQSLSQASSTILRFYCSSWGRRSQMCSSWQHSTLTCAIKPHTPCGTFPTMSVTQCCTLCKCLAHYLCYWPTTHWRHLFFLSHRLSIVLCRSSIRPNMKLCIYRRSFWLMGSMWSSISWVFRRRSSLRVSPKRLFV